MPDEILAEHEKLEEQTKKLEEADKQLAEQQNQIKKQKRNNIIMLIVSIILLIVFIIVCTFSLYRRYDDSIVYDKPVDTDENQQKIDDSPEKDDSQSKIDEVKTDEYGFSVKTVDGKEVHLDRNGKVIPYDSDGRPIVYDENGNRIPFDDDGKLLVYDKDGNRIPVSELWKYITVDKDGKAVLNLADYYSNQKHPEETTQANSGDGHFTIYSVGDVYTAETGSGTLTCDIRNVEDSTHDIIVSLYLSTEELQAHGLSTNGVENDKWLIAQSGLFEPGYQITSIQLGTLPDGSYLPAGTYSLTMNERYYQHETGVLSSYEANIPVTLEVAE